MSDIDRGTSLEEAERQAAAINLYWAERGKSAGAKAVPVYDHRGKFLSFGVESNLSFVVARAIASGASK